MIRRCVITLIAVVMAVSAAACGGARNESVASVPGETAENVRADADGGAGGVGADDFRIGIVTGSYSQSEDDRRGAEAFQEKYGKDRVTLVIYPDNFTEELDVTI